MSAFREQYYSPFDPLSVPGCMLWIDAADSNAYTLSGTTVTGITDKSRSGSAITAFNGTVTYSATGLNSRPTFNLTAGNFQGTLSASIVASNYTHSAFIVVRALGAMANGSAFSTLVNPETNFTVFYRPLDYSTTGPAFRTVSFFATTATTSIAAQTSSPFLWTEYYEGDLTNNSVVSLSNGGSQSAVLAGTNPTQAPAFFTVGTEWNSANGWTRNLWNGTVSEYIVYNNILTGAQRQQVEGYPAWKWGLVGNLGSTHPYKFTPPYVRLFLPPDVGNCELWWDATDRNTITNSGTTLTVWSNKGGTGGTLTPVSGTLTTGSVAQQNGLNMVGMGTGVGQFNATFAAQPRTRFFAARPVVNTTTTTATFLVQQGTVNGRDVIVFESALSGSPREFRQNSTSQTNMLIATSPGNQSNVFAIWLFRNASSTTRNRIASNANPLTLTTSVAAVSYAAATNAAFRMGNLDFGEIISYNIQLGNIEMSNVDGYLAWKWGTQGSLPSDHLFKFRPPLSPAFHPTQIGGCLFWWDMSDRTQFTGVAGSTIGDKSGTGNTGAASAAGRRIPFLTAWGNGNNAARFNNLTSGTLTNAQTASLTAVQNTTFFIVMKVQSVSSGTGTKGFLTNGVGFTISTTNTGFPLTLTFNMNQASTPATTVTLAQGQAVMISGLWAASGGSNTWYSNASVINTVGSANTTAANRWTFGFNDQGAIGTDVGEIIHYNSLLGSNDRYKVEGYLAWKWGLQNNLPNGHPYRTFKP